MSRKRIQRKNPWQPTPTPDILQSRGLGNGKKIREPKLPTTSDIFRTRPFAPRNQDVSTPKDTRSFEEKTKGVEFAYNGFTIPVVQREEVAEENSQEQAEGETRAANIPTFAPSTPPENSILSPFSLFKTDGLGQEGTVQREEVLEEEVEQQAEVGIQEQHLQAPPDDGTIQRLFDECAAEKSEEKDREIIQPKAEISGISGENFNKNLCPYGTTPAI